MVVAHYKPWLFLLGILLIAVVLRVVELVRELGTASLNSISLVTQIGTIIFVLVIVGYALFRKTPSLEIEGEVICIKKWWLGAQSRYTLKDIYKVEYREFSENRWIGGTVSECLVIRFNDGTKIVFTPTAIGYQLVIARLRALKSFHEMPKKATFESSHRIGPILKGLTFWVVVFVALYLYQRYLRL